MDEEEQHLALATQVVKALFGDDVGLVGTVIVLAISHPENQPGDRVLTFFDGSQTAAIGLLELYKQTLVDNLMEEA